MTDRDKGAPARGDTGSNFGKVDPGTTGSDIENLLDSAKVEKTSDAGGGANAERHQAGGLGFGTAAGGADVTGGTGAGDDPQRVDAGPERDRASASGPSGT